MDIGSRRRLPGKPRVACLSGMHRFILCEILAAQRLASAQFNEPVSHPNYAADCCPAAVFAFHVVEMPRRVAHPRVSQGDKSLIGGNRDKDIGSAWKTTETGGGGGRNRTGVDGFAGRCMTTLPPRPGVWPRECAAYSETKKEKPLRLFLQSWRGKRGSNLRGVFA